MPAGDTANLGTEDTPEGTLTFSGEEKAACQEGQNGSAPLISPSKSVSSSQRRP